MSENSLTIFSRGSQLLAEANTIQKAKDLKDLALTAADWARRKGMGEEAVQYARSYALEAERRMGEMLLVAPKAKGAAAGGKKESPRGVYVEPRDTVPTLSDIGLTKRDSSRAQKLARLPVKIFEEVKRGKTNGADAIRDMKRAEVIKNLESIETREVKKAEGVYDVVVVDPPWPMEKIERDVRPNQTAFDYPTMTVDELSELNIPTAHDCHVWLWTTHKFLPVAFWLLTEWGLKYVCTFVWHKPGGFQPIGLPQYNCEFVLYARRGTPLFVDTKSFPTCFNAGRGAHSEKPEEFYEMIRRVTAGRRLDMFNRRKIEGFDGWGKEAANE